MSAKIYPGTSAFFANRSGNHNWLQNDKRPFLSLHTTLPDGQKAYQDLFLNTYAPGLNVKVTKDKVTISFPTDIKHPLFKMLVKSS